ncbi:MAG TPA: hypothetical protein VF930_00530 [Stellaceae bacterium]
MDYAVLTRLMIRTAGVLTIVFAIGSIPVGVLLMWNSGAYSGPGLGAILAVVLSALSLPVLFGAAMFFLAGPITNRSFRTRSSPADQSLEASRFESAALFVLAWYVLVFAIPDAVSVLFRVVAIHGLGAAVPTVMAGEYAKLGGVAAKFIVAFGLIVYSRRLLSAKGTYRA